MDDRTLLELAAKAAGYEVARWTDDGTALLLVGEQEPWNALHNNPHSDCMGDALRLAVKLGMTLRVEGYGASTRIGEGRWHGCEAHLHSGIGPATRRAIVRAAAAMAQTTKEQP